MHLLPILWPKGIPLFQQMLIENPRIHHIVNDFFPLNCNSNRACNSGKRQAAGNGINSQDQLLSQSTDDQEEYSLVAHF